MKREVATLRIELVSDAPEARDFLLKSIVREIDTPQRMVCSRSLVNGLVKARLTRVTLARVRRAPRLKKKAAR